VNSDEQATIHIGEQRPIIRSEIDNSGDTPTISYELDGDYGDEEITEVDLGMGDGPKMERTYTTNKGYLDLGTKLTVLPSVKTEEEVYLRVVPELMSVRAENNFVTASEGLSAIVSYPTLFRTYVRSQFTLKSGQTVAIGGLVSEDERVEENGIPLLKDIPWIGKWLFTYENTNVTRSETIIFITVKVVSGKELQTVAGVPVRAGLAQEEIDRIHEEDADGAEYNEDRAREALEAAKDAEDKKFENRVNKGIKRLFGLEKEDTADSLKPPESYLEE
jgi:Flp pilus assembly secretin CpaC